MRYGAPNPSPARHSPAQQRAIVFFNPRSGANLDREKPDTLDSVCSVLQRQGWYVEPLALNDEALNDLPVRLALERPAALVVIGGDGSIRSLLPAATATDTPLVVIPSGTMNLLARSLNIPFEPPDAASLVSRGHVVSIDLASVNGELYACHAMLGRSPHLTRLRERLRGLGLIAGFGIFLRLVMREIRRNWRAAFLVQSAAVGQAGAGRWLRAHTLVVANNLVDQSSPLGLIKPRLDEGVLGLYVIAPATSWSWVRFLTRWLVGARQKSPDAKSLVAPRFTISTRPRHVWLSLDGEPIRLQGPLQFITLPRALRVFAPADVSAGNDRAPR